MNRRCWVHYEAFEYGDEPPSESHVEVPDTNVLQQRLAALEAAVREAMRVLKIMRYPSTNDEVAVAANYQIDQVIKQAQHALAQEELERARLEHLEDDYTPHDEGDK